MPVMKPPARPPLDTQLPALSERDSLQDLQDAHDLGLTPDDDPNRPETEEDGLRAEALRRLKVRLMYEALPALARDSSTSADQASGKDKSLPGSPT